MVTHTTMIDLITKINAGGSEQRIKFTNKQASKSLNRLKRSLNAKSCCISTNNMLEAELSDNMCQSKQ